MRYGLAEQNTHPVVFALYRQVPAALRAGNKGIGGGVGRGRAGGWTGRA